MVFPLWIYTGNFTLALDRGVQTSNDDQQLNIEDYKRIEGIWMSEDKTSRQFPYHFAAGSD